MSAMMQSAWCSRRLARRVSILAVLIVALAIGGGVQAQELASDPPPTRPTPEAVNKNESGSLESMAAAPAGPAFIQDGGFELGSPNPVWSEFSTNFGTPLCTTAACGFGGGTGPHSGNWWIWFGGVSTGIEEGSMMQTDTFPAGTCELSFWLEIPVGGGTGNDFLQVWIDSDLLFSATDLDAGSFSTYQEVSLDVSGYDNGASHDLIFYSKTSGNGTTNFFVDDVVLDPYPYTFVDVRACHWAWQFVEALAAAGVTAGFPDGTYRPENTVTRAEMAVFLKKGIHGSSYFPPSPNGSHPFSDISGHWAEAWIEDLYDEGFTSGFPDGTYRPGNNVTRAEMAIFLLKGKHGKNYTPPTPSGGAFTDTSGHWAEAWIEQLKEEGITSGFPDGSYRPENPASRAEMAVFLVNTFALPVP